MLKYRGMQGKSSDLSNHVRSLASGLSNSDNTFATARNIGKLRASSVPLTTRTKGVVGKSDRVDFFKFTVEPGANFPTSQSTYKISGGAIKISVYFQHPELTNNAIVFGGSGLFKGSSSFLNDQTPTNNQTFTPITGYIKVETTGKKKVKYDLTETYTPASNSFVSDDFVSDDFVSDDFFSDSFFTDSFF